MAEVNRAIGRDTQAVRVNQRFASDLVENGCDRTIRGDALKERQFNMNFPTSISLGGKTIQTVAMAAPVPENNADYHWDAYAMSDRELRRTFSMQTCCGCHCGDTKTQFFHITPRPAGKEAVVSAYMKMGGEKATVQDPGSKRKVTLQEMDERQLVFESLLNPGLSSTKVRRIREARLARAH